MKIRLSSCRDKLLKKKKLRWLLTCARRLPSTAIRKDEKVLNALKRRKAKAKVRASCKRRHDKTTFFKDPNKISKAKRKKTKHIANVKDQTKNLIGSLYCSISQK